MVEGPPRVVRLTGRVQSRLVDGAEFWHTVVTRARAVGITFLAAAVAYYAFLSLLPALLLVLAIGSALGGEMLANALVAAAGDLLAPAGEALVREALENAAGRTGATVLGMGLLLWSMLKVFRGLDVAFMKVYSVEGAASLTDQIRDGVVAVGGVGGGLGIMFVVGAGLSALDLDPGLGVLGILTLPGVLAVVFLPLFYVFPDVDLSLRSVLPGTLLAALGWTVLQTGFQIYAGNAGQYQAYGVLGGVLLLVMWFYFAAIVLLFGAVVNVIVWESGDSGGRASSNPDPTDQGRG
jgi:YihY family inner membrane protein